MDDKEHGYIFAMKLEEGRIYGGTVTGKTMADAIAQIETRFVCFQSVIEIEIKSIAELINSRFYCWQLTNDDHRHILQIADEQWTLVIDTTSDGHVKLKGAYHDRP